RIRLERTVRCREEHIRLERIATIFRNHVQPDSAAGCFSGYGAGLVAHFREHHGIEVLLDRAISLDSIEAHTVDLNTVIAWIGPMSRHVGLLHTLSSTHVGQRLRYARQNGADRLDVAPSLGHGLDQ